jgi:hypothetical protein
MDWWVYLLLAITVFFTIILWNANNSKSYQRLRKARAVWTDANQEFKDKVNTQALRVELDSLRSQIANIFDS